MVRVPAFQAGYAGSIPVTRSRLPAPSARHPTRPARPHPLQRPGGATYRRYDAGAARSPKVRCTHARRERSRVRRQAQADERVYFSHCFVRESSVTLFSRKESAMTTHAKAVSDWIAALPPRSFFATTDAPGPARAVETALSRLATPDGPIQRVRQGLYWKQPPATPFGRPRPDPTDAAFAAAGAGSGQIGRAHV